MKGVFIKNERYYRGVVYEWNLPTGSTCPFSEQCTVTVNRATGKFKAVNGKYKCYAAAPERFPAVREHRHGNFDYTRQGGVPIIPKGCKAVRIHAAGDFYNQAYFDTWLAVAKNNPSVEFWAYTKSIQYWVNRINDIPNNLILTASYGGRQDALIEQYKLKNVKVFTMIHQIPKDLQIDTNDDLARLRNVNFALLDYDKI